MALVRFTSIVLNFELLKKSIRDLRNILEAKLLKCISRLSLGSKLMGPPSGYYETSKEYYSISPRVQYIKVIPETGPKQLYPLPTSSESGLHWRFLKNNFLFIPEQYVVSIPNGRTVYGNCWIITENDKVISELSRQFGHVGLPGTMKVFKTLFFPRVKKLKGDVCVVGYAGSDNYWHWMFDIMPRFKLLVDSGLLEKCQWIVINEMVRPYQWETIKLLDIPSDKLIFANRSMHLEAERLHIPSVPTYKEHVPLWSVRFLQKLFPYSSNRHDRCIYITRKNARSRKIVNEKELFGLLGNLNFEFIELEGLSVIEQALLFNEAKIVVAAHGASQTNLVFCKPGTTVIEIFSPLWVHYCFWSLSVQLELKYYYIMGEGDYVSEENYKIDKDADIVVNIPKVNELLSEIRNNILAH